jgi:Uma2 family endonuclease
MVSVGFRLFTDRLVVRAPDVAFVENSRLVDAADDGFMDGAPTLAVEVISPDDRDVDIDEKVREYLAAGTRRVWLVRPRTKTVAVHTPDGMARTYGVSDVLDSDAAGFEKPGFALRLAELFGP